MRVIKQILFILPASVMSTFQTFSVGINKLVLVVQIFSSPMILAAKIKFEI